MHYSFASRRFQRADGPHSGSMQCSAMRYTTKKECRAFWCFSAERVFLFHFCGCSSVFSDGMPFQI